MKNQCVNDVSYDTEHALLEYGPNPTLQILIAKKRRQRAQKHLTPSQKIVQEVGLDTEHAILE